MANEEKQKKIARNPQAENSIRHNINSYALNVGFCFRLFNSVNICIDDFIPLYTHKHTNVIIDCAWEKVRCTHHFIDSTYSESCKCQLILYVFS